jgi:hypothetical protein
VNSRSTNAASVACAHSIGLLFATYPFEASFEPENEKAVYQIERDFHVTDRLDHMLDISCIQPGTGAATPKEWECTRYSETCG